VCRAGVTGGILAGLEFVFPALVFPAIVLLAIIAFGLVVGV
jgi:hypothetical protein